MDLIYKWENTPLPEPIPLKEFKPAYPQLPVLKTYKGRFPMKYWEHWTKRSYTDIVPVKSWICPVKLKQLAEEVGIPPDDLQLHRVLERLKDGANIGCKGNGRLPTLCPNSPSASEFGQRVADSLQGWIAEGLCFGPLQKHELPWSDFSSNPILVKLKPNGKARICVNMSAPHQKDTDSMGSPTSVNDGIDPDEFPATMSSTKSFCQSLMKAGCPAEMAKLGTCNN